MEIEYTGRQTILTKKLKIQAEAGLASIAKLVGRTASAHVFLTSEKYRRIAEVTLKTRRCNLVANCEATEMEVSLHDALAKLEQQAIRHKQRSSTVKRHPKGVLAGIKATARQSDLDATLETKSTKPVVRSKSSTIARNHSENGTARRALPMVVHSFPSKSPITEPHIVRSIDSAAMRPMSLEVAVKEAALRDRDVFVFRDLGGQALVLHRQRDGRMELIQVP